MSSNNGNGTGGHIFGQLNSAAGLFGATAAASNPNTLGQLTTPANGTASTTASSTDAATSNVPSLFGTGQSSKPEITSSTSSLFGNNLGTKTTGLFANPSTTSASFSFGTTSTAPANKEDKPQTTPGGFFNFPPSTTPTIFGASSAGLSTPAKPFSLNTSTTPLGPPPKENDQTAKESIFGAGNSSKGSTIFGNTGPILTSKTFNKEGSFFNPARASAPTSKDSELANVTVPAPSSTPATTSSTQIPTTTASKSQFGSVAENASKLSVPERKPDLFGGSGNISKSQDTTSASPAPSTFAQTPTIFGSFGGSTKIPAATTSSAFALTSSAENKSAIPSTSTPTVSLASAPKTNAPATSENLTSETKSGSNVGLAPSNSASALPLGSSTIGPTPQLARLKNKTMDEIITRWASDLSKYQKEFQEQAEQVAAWDRLMVENGEKIQKLYLSTFEAERQNAEIERQLLNVESQQEEVASWLDKYEREIDDMFSRQIGHNDTLQGVDQEREKTYKLAEKLTDRLDEMGKNLASMIYAINEASTTLSKTGKPDDPLSSILRVLNNHLTTLQWIDENAEALKYKIKDAQKIGQNLGSNENVGTDSKSAEYFYRSLLGRK